MASFACCLPPFFPFPFPFLPFLPFPPSLPLPGDRGGSGQSRAQWSSAPQFRQGFSGPGDFFAPLFLGVAPLFLGVALRLLGDLLGLPLPLGDRLPAASLPDTIPPLIPPLNTEES